MTNSGQRENQTHTNDHREPLARIFDPFGLDDGSLGEEAYRFSERGVIEEAAVSAAGEHFLLATRLAREGNDNALDDAWETVLTSAIPRLKLRLIGKAALNDDEPNRFVFLVEKTFKRPFRGRFGERIADDVSLLAIFEAVSQIRNWKSARDPIFYVLKTFMIESSRSLRELNRVNSEHEFGLGGKVVATEPLEEQEEEIAQSPVPSGSILLTKLYTCAENSGQRDYLRLISQGCNSSEACKIANLSRSTARALAARCRRNVEI